MNERGISLLEVVITAVLLGLLAGVATFSVNQYMINGKKRIAQSDINTLAAATRLYLMEHTFPASFNAATELVPQYLPELPKDPFTTNSADYGFEIITYDGSPTIRIFSRGPQDNPVQRYIR
ncbi:MAG TPA: hypothetical protein VEC37_12530 [Bacillota bacterium]|nr:hypothetical protein [Bacillota bacterium]